MSNEFVMVPRELTPEMREAFHSSYEAYEDGRGECPDSQWRAMLRAAPKTASAEPSAPVERDEQAAVEEIAKLIYENWAGQPDYVPWVDSGNSLKQDDARRQARAALERKPS